MAVLYWKPCYNEAHYNEVGLYDRRNKYVYVILLLRVSWFSIA